MPVASVGKYNFEQQAEKKEKKTLTLMLCILRLTEETDLWEQLSQKPKKYKRFYKHIHEK